MTRCHRLFTLIVFALTAVVLQAQSAEVTYVDNRGKMRSDKGTVDGHTYKGLVFKRTRNASPRTISEDNLIRVVYSRRPEGFDEAVALYDRGAWRDAVGAFEDVIGGLKSRYGWARQECLYLAADAKYRMGDEAGYRALVQQLRDAVPDSRYLPRAEIRDAEIALARGQGAAAKFSAIADKPYAASYVAQGAFGVVRAHLAKDDVTKAKAALAKASTKAQGPEAALRSKIMEARIAFASKDLSGAEGMFKGLLEQGAAEYAKEGGTRNLFVFAAGANGLGDVLYEQGKFAAASMEYSKTFALLRGEPGLDPQVGWAMWKFAKCCSQIANATKDEEQQKVYGRRFQSMRSRVANEYANTRGGQLARKEIGG